MRGCLVGVGVVSALLFLPVLAATSTGTANANSTGSPGAGNRVGTSGLWTTEPYVPIPANPGQEVAQVPPANVFVQTRAGGFPDSFPIFPQPQCTTWVAHNRLVTWSGNANQWITNASAKGIPISSIPQVGDIVVFNGGTFHYNVPGFSGYFSYSAQFGHTAVVVAVTTTTYTVSEMNNPAFPAGIPDSRTIPYQPSLPNGDPAVLGYIPPTANG